MIISFGRRDRAVVHGSLNIFTRDSSLKGFSDKRGPCGMGR